MTLLPSFGHWLARSYIHVGLLRVHLKPWAFDDGLLLQGLLFTGVHEGKCVYTEYSGTVERITIAGGRSYRFIRS